MRCHLRVIRGCVLGEPSCRGKLVVSRIKTYLEMVHGNLRMRLKNCHAGIISSFLRTPLRGCSFVGESPPPVCSSLVSGMNLSRTMLSRRPGIREPWRSAGPEIDDHGFDFSVKGEVYWAGDCTGVVSTSSTCAVKPLEMESESTDREELIVLRLSRYRFTSMRLLK